MSPIIHMIIHDARVVYSGLDSNEQPIKFVWFLNKPQNVSGCKDTPKNFWGPSFG